MAAHNNTANRFHDDVIVLEDDAPTRPSGRQLAFEDFAGNIVVVDLVSDDEETANVNRVDSFANTAPESFSEVTVDDALREILQYVEERFGRLAQGPNMVALLLSELLDEPYPRVNRKRSSAAAELDDKPAEVDYASTNRAVNDLNIYRRIAHDVLASKFPRMPAVLINQALSAHSHLYAPTFIYLHSVLPSNYSPLKSSRGLKASIARDLQTPTGRQVSAEIAYIETWFEGRAMKEALERRKRQEEEDEEAARQLNFQEHEVNGGLLECGCCFDECPLNCMTACAEGHLFCLDCARRNAETTVGNGGHFFKCMDVSGCNAEFTSAEISRFVDAKTIALRDKLASGDAIREASIEGFVTCPFCDYGAIVDDENDKEFRCQNKDCEIVSCRLCRSESHIPMSCDEYKKEHKLSAKHLVEEAMSEALISKCNKCSKPFVKISGCNKMTCSCGNRQCYVCGENILDYTHFDRVRKDGSKCVLHEKDESRLESKVLNAREEAVKKVLEEEEGLDEEDVKVDVSKPQPQAQQPGAHVFGAQFVQQFVPWAWDGGAPPGVPAMGQNAPQNFAVQMQNGLFIHGPAPPQFQPAQHYPFQPPQRQQFQYQVQGQLAGQPGIHPVPPPQQIVPVPPAPRPRAPKRRR